MAEFKVVIGDSKTGKCKQVVVSGDNTRSLLGKKIGDKLKGESIDMPGYEFEITGGSDYAGFPMRKDLEGPIRKQIFAVRGTGLKTIKGGDKIRKTVCGNTIHEKIVQVSLKVLKHGKDPLFAEGEAEKKKEDKKEAKKE